MTEVFQPFSSSIRPISATQSYVRPGIPKTREWAGNPGFSRIRFCLQAPNSPILGRQMPKVSGYNPEYSRFAEIVGGDLVRTRLLAAAVFA
jgi:hypothetical protein